MNEYEKKVALAKKVKINIPVVITYINNTSLMNQQFKLCMKVKRDGTKCGIIPMIILSKTNMFQIRYLILIQIRLII